MSSIVNSQNGEIKIGDVLGAAITSTPGIKTITIKWSDPKNVILDGSTLASWDGTKVVRKVGSAPSNIDDGTLIVDSKTRDNYAATGYTDSDSELEYGVTYYYRFFPYTTTGEITDGTSFSVVPIKAAGSVTLSSNSVTLDANHTSVTVTASGATGTLSVSSSDPSVATASESSGTITVASVNDTNGTATVTVSVAASANYEATTATIAVTAQFALIYGFHQNFSDTNPDTCITYISGTENANYSPMMTNEGEGTATAGSWTTFLTDVLKNKPAMVKTDGELDYWLDPTDYTKKLDGTTPSDVANTSYSGAGAFAWIDKFYMKEVYAANGDSRDVYFAFGNKPDNNYYPVGFVDGDNNELEGMWIPLFYPIASNYKILGNATLSDNLTTAQEKSKMDSISNRARFFAGEALNIIRDLQFMLFKSTDIKKKAGYGNCDGIYNTGSKNNAIISNGNVVGFKGTGDKLSANKQFHSIVLGTYELWLRDPYLLLVNGDLKYSEKYNYDISGNTYQTSSDTSWKTANDNAFYYGSHLVKISNQFGSFIKRENNASQTTGLCGSTNADKTGLRINTRFGARAMGLNVGPNTIDFRNEPSTKGWYMTAPFILLPSNGYTPIS